MAQSVDNKILSLIANVQTKEQGYRLLMSTYQERLYWHIRRMTHIHADADDVVQNTFIKVFKNIQRFEGKSKLYTWLYRIATNEAITFLKGKNRKKTDSINDNEGFFEELKADNYWDGDKAQALLQRAISLLPLKQKTVFTMRYYENMSYREMSEILETSEGALKASYHHAMKKVELFIKENSDLIL